MNPILAGILIAVGVIVLLFFFLIITYRPKKAKFAPFYGKNFAHRGLYEKDQSIPENSLAAFDRACEHGYGMELDVQLSKDGQVVVFHDDTLTRMCGVDRRVDELDYSELREFRLKGTDQHIPLFTEVLSAVRGRTPVIVELKDGGRNSELCQKTLDLIEAYSGDFCVESFNPLIVAWFRFHAHHIVRGQLSQQPEIYKKGALMRVILGCTLLNFAARPHFIAYRIGRKPFPVKLAELSGAKKVAWTSHSADTEKDFDVVIFEHYLPEIKYK